MNNLFYLIDHQNKSRAYREALLSAGFEMTSDLNQARFILADCDAEVYWNRFDQVRKRGGKIFIYPHSGRAWLGWDGFLKKYKHTTGYFIVSQENIKIIAAYSGKVPANMFVTGWTYCDFGLYRPNRAPQKILFAPIHPNANGWISDVDKDLNARTYQKLVELCLHKGYTLKVRHIKDFRTNGLWPVRGVKMIQAQPDQGHSEIDRADVVVAHETFAYIAVARGTPVVMMGQDVPHHFGNKPEKFRYVESWDKYKDMLLYPYDILQGNSIDASEYIIKQACLTEATEWKQRLLGEQFDPEKFITLIRSLL